MAANNFVPSSITTALRIHKPPTTACSANYFRAVGHGVVGGTQPLEPGLTDFVIGNLTDQVSIFEEHVKLRLDKFLQGQDVAYLAYGASGVGKTYTMFGPGVKLTDDVLSYGVVPRSISYIFSSFETLDDDTVPYIKMTIFEVYPWAVKDLLQINNRIAVNNNPVLYPNEKGFLKPNLTKYKCSSAGQTIQVLKMALARRELRPGNHNNRHLGTAIVSFELYKQEFKGGIRVDMLVSQAVFVDAATSKFIHPVIGRPINFEIYNLSLLVNSHGNQIQTQDNEFVVNCVFYRLLQGLFDGRSDTLIFCCISSSVDDLDQSSSSLSLLWSIHIEKLKLSLSTSVPRFNLEAPRKLHQRKI